MSIEYIIKFDSEGEPVPCECCGMVAPVYLFRHSGDNPQNACEFCSTTMTCNYLLLSEVGDTEYLRSQIWLAAACSHNLLLAKLTPQAESVRV